VADKENMEADCSWYIRNNCRFVYSYLWSAFFLLCFGIGDNVDAWDVFTTPACWANIIIGSVVILGGVYTVKRKPWWFVVACFVCAILAEIIIWHLFYTYDLYK